MEIVYLYNEAGKTRIPFYGNNKSMFTKLSELSGKWNEIQSEFIFNKSLDADELSRNFPDTPFVFVDPKSSLPVKVFGFFGRSWDKKVIPYFPDNVTDIISSPQLPGIFTKHFESKLETELRSRKYSPRTICAYIYYNRLLCSIIQKTPDAIKPEDIKHFLAILERGKNYSSSSMNLAISAIKFFFRNVLKRDIINEKVRPHHDKRLPMVLDKKEINKILTLEKNTKHRLLLMLVYSSGLRVSEVVSLKKEHIDLTRRVIYINLGKGRKDRFTILSEKAANFITRYLTINDIQNWIFPGQPATRHLTIRSAQHIFDNAIRRAEISKKVSIHSLRHTFATHLLESGTDIRYIQELLGHSNIRTTERYTHIARRNVLNIQSPLDSL